MFRVKITTKRDNTITLSGVESWVITDYGILEIIFEDRDSLFYYSPHFWNYFSVIGLEEEEDVSRLLE